MAVAAEEAVTVDVEEAVEVSLNDLYHTTWLTLKRI
jgi:hypothetical protein